MKVFTLALITVTLYACSANKHLTGDYEKYANKHSTVAVLPYDITIIGKEARELSPEELDEIILDESELFQESLYAEILKRTGARDKDIHISVQDVRKTNRLLAEADIDGLNIGEYSSGELGKILGVDAVVSTKLIKEGFLNREVALIAEILTEGITLPNPILYSDKRKMTRTSKVDVYAYILDTESESAIWQYDTECDLRWDSEPSEVIENINGRISKKFPYRK